MEIYELRYFLAVAELENLNRAAAVNHISAGSLSKAISRLEDEFKVQLFSRSGRGIRLTEEGLMFRKHAQNLLQHEENIRMEMIRQQNGPTSISISSGEILHSSLSVELSKKIIELCPQTNIRYLTCSDAVAIEQVMQGETHFALITSEPPKDLESKILTRVQFQVCASPNHPLVKGSKKRKLKTQDILEYDFVIPDGSFLGKIQKSATPDGWKEEQFPRKIRYRASGIKLIENLICEGMALGYLPDHFVQSSGFVPIEMGDCPSNCKQIVYLIAKISEDSGWLKRLWKQL